MDKFNKATKQVLDYLADNHYCKTILSVNKVCFNRLRQYLEESDISYSQETVNDWFDSIKAGLSKGLQSSYKNALMRLSDVMTEGSISMEHDTRHLMSYTVLNSYWKNVLDEFLRSLEKICAQDTIRGYKNSCARFLIYVQNKGISSASELSYSCIIKFYEDDIHLGIWGKSLLNGRIPALLNYFYEQGTLTFGYTRLFHYLSLGKGSYWNDIDNSVHCKIREAIDAAETVSSQVLVEQLNAELYSEDSILSLRKKAMLLLGLKMGMRASDIVKLKYDDINWKTASIRFVQDKTEVEVELPMPVDVGNVLFRYITEERGRKKDPRIFLGEKAPHRPVGRATCGRALKTALPDRHAEGSGFHVTRKTYATNLLREGIGAATVADALGQRGTSSVHRYLSLDTERMRMCALSLEDNGIGGWDYGK